MSSVIRLNGAVSILLQCPLSFFVRKIFLSESDHTTQGVIFKFFREYHHLVWVYASNPVMILQPLGKGVY